MRNSFAVVIAGCPTTANMASIGDCLKRVVGSIAPRRARGVRNGRRMGELRPVRRGNSARLPSVQVNASRLPPSIPSMRPAEAATQAINRRISANRFFEIATSAIRNATVRARPATFAPILISFSSSVVSDQSLIGSGGGRRAQKIAEVAGERVKLKAKDVAGEGAARHPRPFDRALALLDPCRRFRARCRKRRRSRRGGLCWSR